MSKSKQVELLHKASPRSDGISLLTVPMPIRQGILACWRDTDCRK